MRTAVCACAATLTVLLLPAVAIAQIRCPNGSSALSPAAAEAAREAQEGNDEAALRGAEAAVAANPDNPYDHWVLGAAASTLGKFAQAERAFRTAATACPALQENIATHWTRAGDIAIELGFVELDRGDQARAIFYWEWATRFRDDYPRRTP